MDKAQRDLQHRVMAHMLPTCASLGLTIPQHKAICAAVIKLLGTEVCARDKRPTGPDWDQALPEGLSSERLQRAFQTTLPARLSSVQRKQEAESNIV